MIFLCISFVLWALIATVEMGKPAIKKLAQQSPSRAPSKSRRPDKAPRKTRRPDKVHLKTRVPELNEDELIKSINDLTPIKQIFIEFCFKSGLNPIGITDEDFEVAYQVIAALFAKKEIMAEDITRHFSAALRIAHGFRVNDTESVRKAIAISGETVCLEISRKMNEGIRVIGLLKEFAPPEFLWNVRRESSFPTQVPTGGYNSIEPNISVEMWREAAALFAAEDE